MKPRPSPKKKVEFKLKSLEGKNRGVYYNDPGIVKKLNCGICGTRMTVERNALRPSRYIRKKSRADCFICPHYKKEWHESVEDLIIEAESTASTKIRKIIEEEIAEILSTRKVPE